MWWEKTEKELISIDNGIMIAAIVARGLCPNDLWCSMNVNQQAFVSPAKWRKFCEEYDYKMKTEWSNDAEDEDHDVIKIN